MGCATGQTIKLHRSEPCVADVLEGNARAALVRGSGEQLLANLPAESVDLFLSDPPYSSGGMVRSDRAHGNKATTKYTHSRSYDLDILGDTRDALGYLAWASVWLRDVHRALRPGSIAAVFTDWRQLPALTMAMQAGGLIYRGVMTWHKGQGSRPQPGRPRQEDEFIVWGTAGPRPTEGPPLRGHFEGPTPPHERYMVCSKPEALMEELMAMAPAGGLVVDPFLGAGTTAVAALRTGRRIVGAELSEKNLEVARRRLAGEGLEMVATAPRRARERRAA